MRVNCTVSTYRSLYGIYRALKSAIKSASLGHWSPLAGQHSADSPHCTCVDWSRERCEAVCHQAIVPLCADPSLPWFGDSHLNWVSLRFTRWKSHPVFHPSAEPSSCCLSCSRAVCRTDEITAAGWHQWRRSLPLLESIGFVARVRSILILDQAPL